MSEKTEHILQLSAPRLPALLLCRCTSQSSPPLQSNSPAWKQPGYETISNILMWILNWSTGTLTCVKRASTGFLLWHVRISQTWHDVHLSLWEKRVSLDDLVVSEGHAAAHTLLYTHVSRVTVPLATGLRDHLIGAEEPEEALLEVLWATYTAAIELYRETQWEGRADGILVRLDDFKIGTS